MEFVPPFDMKAFLETPWIDGGWESSIWIVIMGILVNTACGLVGNFLILRKMALVGDAISHSLLPGIAIVFLLSNSRSTGLMVAGALAAGLVTVWMIEFIHKKTRVKEDAALGVTFTTLFAIGVILISVFADHVDLDLECVLYGEIGFIYFDDSAAILGLDIPWPVLRMAGTLILVLILLLCFYKELLVTSFDSGLATSLGIPVNIAHYGLMMILSLVIVFSFESVGAILVIAMLIMPGATSALLSERLPTVLSLSAFFAAAYSLGGLHLATWLDCSPAGAMVTCGFFLFCIVWFFSPKRGLLTLWIKKYRSRGAIEAPTAN
jgi:manganese/zinc/iron transport system permease protein